MNSYGYMIATASQIGYPYSNKDRTTVQPLECDNALEAFISFIKTLLPQTVVRLVIEGATGSGKSTLIREIEEALENREVNGCYVDLRVCSADIFMAKRGGFREKYLNEAHRLCRAKCNRLSQQYVPKKTIRVICVDNQNTGKDSSPYLGGEVKTLHLLMVPPKCITTREAGMILGRRNLHDNSPAYAHGKIIAVLRDCNNLQPKENVTRVVVQFKCSASDIAEAREAIKNLPEPGLVKRVSLGRLQETLKVVKAGPVYKAAPGSNSRLAKICQRIARNNDMDPVNNLGVTLGYQPGPKKREHIERFLLGEEVTLTTHDFYLCVGLYGDKFSFFTVSLLADSFGGNRLIEVHATTKAPLHLTVGTANGAQPVQSGLYLINDRSSN